ncbi:16690_t:CDS:2 [Entrophospora sp. SA101]|nr:2735_t:CDS:2 [Entrophospora sp. SA101]CAJ0769195.1 16690_t:CDS:2 [Entrophospora sp. SA101]CAJ0843329.1 3731_t:CDS:2 [Entrophospora sp. SA101]
MIILLQNKFLYVPYLPIGCRNDRFDESLIDKRLVCKLVEAKSDDGCKLIGIIIRNKSLKGENPSIIRDAIENFSKQDPVLIYFQGNAGNMLHRLPIFHRLLLPTTSKSTITNLIIVAIGYRGYWLSNGSPSEDGLKMDATSIYKFVRSLYPENPIYVYGHSLGGAVALYLASHPQIQSDIKGTIIENTFTSIKDMVIELYPQKWLPYRYLASIPLFLRNRWENDEMEMEPVRALAFETGILEQINKLGINLNERVVDDTYNTNDMGFELFVLHAEIRIILDQI